MRAIKCDICGAFELGSGAEVDVDGRDYIACKKCIIAIKALIQKLSDAPKEIAG